MCFPRSLKRHAKFGKVILKGAPAEEEPATTACAHVLEGAGPRPGNPQREAVFAEGNSKRHAVSGISMIDHDYLGSRVQMSGTEYDPELTAPTFTSTSRPARGPVSISRARIYGGAQEEVTAHLSNRWARS